MEDNFYKAFEDRHRGSTDLVRSRLKVYLPFVVPLKKIHPKPQALDLGCGRGEFLGLLQEEGFSATGVDLDKGMLSACEETKIKVIRSDALEYIKKLPEESISLVSAIHFVEHIPFETLRALSHEIYRVLKPGGLLIFETPNSENLLVGTSSFYLDSTHERPIPAQLLAFVCEQAQFFRVKTLFLQEPKQQEDEPIGLWKILEGVSPDYAIVAQKKASHEMLTVFDEAFNQEYGVRLEDLVSKYDDDINQRALRIEANLIAIKKNETNAISQLQNLILKLGQSIQDQAKDLSNRMGQIEKFRESPNARYEEQLLKSQSRIRSLEQELEENQKESADKAAYWFSIADGFHQELKKIQAARSSKISKFLSALNPKQIYYFFIQGLEAIVKKMTLCLVRQVLKRPKYKVFFSRRLRNFPRLQVWLYHLKLREKASEMAATSSQDNPICVVLGKNLSPHAFRVYFELLSAVKEIG